MIDEHAPHHLRRYPQKLCAILPGCVLIDESQVGLIYERRWLQRVIPPFASQVCGSPPVEFVVHDRYQLVSRTDIAVAPCTKQSGHVRARSIDPLISAILRAPFDSVKRVLAPLHTLRE